MYDDDLERLSEGFSCLEPISSIHLCVLTSPLSVIFIRLIKHTKQLLEENEERLCIKVLQTLREMMTKDRGYGEKVRTVCLPLSRLY